LKRQKSLPLQAFLFAGRIPLRSQAGRSANYNQGVMMAASTRQLTFRSGREQCAADLYLPDGVESPPVVVMGHGLGALRSFRIPEYAQYFVSRGLAVFTFDYRYWGDSSGQPRQLLNPRWQLADWHAALACVRQLQEVDGRRLGIWGSSFAGAHVIHVAAEDHQVGAVVAQVLAADLASAVRGFGLSYLLKSTAAGVVDTLRGLLGMSPLYFPLVGRPGETAVMNTPECWDGYLQLVPEGSDWENKVTARSLLLMPWYRAVKVAGRVRAPTLLMGGIRDSLVDIEDIRKLARELPGAELREYDCNHFEPYYPPLFDTFARVQADFFIDKLQAQAAG
jgi:alpha-beta hydrolase superfamily lysophospholipase